MNGVFDREARCARDAPQPTPAPHPPRGSPDALIPVWEWMPGASPHPAGGQLRPHRGREPGGCRAARRHLCAGASRPGSTSCTRRFRGALLAGGSPHLPAPRARVPRPPRASPHAACVSRPTRPQPVRSPRPRPTLPPTPLRRGATLIRRVRPAPPRGGNPAAGPAARSGPSFSPASTRCRLLLPRQP